MAIAADFVFITGFQRSGTTALRSAIGACRNVHSIGEVFHDDQRAHAEGNFFIFLNSKPKLAKAYLNASAASAELIYQAYVEHLAALSEKPKLTVDVKFNLWLNLQPNWRFPTDRPWLIERLIQDGAGFVILHRRNYFAQYLSNEFAAASRQFHYLKGERAKPLQVEISAESFLRFAEFQDILQAAFDRYLYDSSRVVRLFYEDIFNGGEISAFATEMLRSLVGFNEPVLSTELVKTPIKPRDAIINADEFIEAVRHTDRWEMVREILEP